MPCSFMYCIYLFMIYPALHMIYTWPRHYGDSGEQVKCDLPSFETSIIVAFISINFLAYRLLASETTNFLALAWHFNFLSLVLVLDS